MSSFAPLVIYCLLIVLASLLGGWVPLVVRLTHRRLEILVSFVSGVMLGVALLHMLPHAWMQQAAETTAAAGEPAIGHGAIGPIMVWVLVGLLAMFFVERIFCFHHHDVQPGAGGEAGPCDRGHGHELTWTGAAIGLTLHSLVAGVALAASISSGADAGTWAAGFGTFLAIVLHKPFDSMTLGTLMAVGRRSARARHLVNLGFGLVVPLGAFLFVIGAEVVSSGATTMISAALAFSAGTFLCISLSDLLPELQFHQHDRFKLSAALLAGLAVAWGAAQREARGHEPSRPAPVSLNP
jgi:zinc and cadmium transporter